MCNIVGCDKVDLEYLGRNLLCLKEAIEASVCFLALDA